MAPIYVGPLRLAQSRYAPSPQAGLYGVRSPTSRVQQASRPVFGATSADPPADDNTTIANPHKTAAANAMEALSAGAQLALDQDAEVQRKAEEHVIELVKASSAVDTTHKLLNLIRKTMKKENPEGGDTSLNVLRTLWEDLEKMYKALHDTQVTLPTLFNKQKENLDLFVSSMVSEAGEASHTQVVARKNETLEQQRKVTPDQNQAYTKSEARIEPQLNNADSLVDHFSKLAVANEKLCPSFVTLENEAKNKADELEKKCMSMRDELSALHFEKEQITITSDTRKKAVGDLQYQLKAAEMRDTDHYEKEISRLRADCENEATNVETLNATIKAMRTSDGDMKQALNKLKAENSLLQGKFNNQSAEYSKIFANCDIASQKISSLTAEIDTLREQKADLAQKVKQASKLEEETTELRKSLVDIQEQLAKVNTERDTASAEVSLSKEKTQMLTTRVKQLENDLMAKQVTDQKHSTALAIIKDENTMLRATLKNLEEQKNPKIGDAIPQLEMEALEIEVVKANLRAAVENKSELEEGLKQWKALAEKSYAKYKEVLPASRHTMALRQENDELKAQLEKCSTGGSAGACADRDASYWHNKYEELLSSIE